MNINIREARNGFVVDRTVEMSNKSGSQAELATTTEIYKEAEEVKERVEEWLSGGDSSLED